MFKQISIYRVTFGDKDRSHSSNLFAVKKYEELHIAIKEYCKLMKKIGTGIINYDRYVVEGEVMTPYLFEQTDQ